MTPKKAIDIVIFRKKYELNGKQIHLMFMDRNFRAAL